jgi:hypothetical protein
MTDGNWQERYAAWNDLGQCLAAISGWCLLAMKRERSVAGRGGPVVSGRRGLNQWRWKRGPCLVGGEY